MHTFNPPGENEMTNDTTTNRVAGIGEMIIPESDGCHSTLLKQLKAILADANWSTEFCARTGEIMIRTGLDHDMGGDLFRIDGDDE
jgi:hypothetical protein